MLQQVTSTDDRFKPIVLSPGFNILLSDKTQESSDTDSRNGAGKSSLIEIVHFLLGMGRLTDSVLANPELSRHTFSLEMDWPEREAGLRVSRSLTPRNRSRVELQPNIVGGQRLFESGSATISEWVEELGKSLFAFPHDHKGISARSLLSLYIRRVSQHGLDDPVQTFPRQSITEATTNIAYLLGLDWRLASGYQQLAGRESLRRKLREAIKDPAFSLVIGSVSELRGLVTAATRRAQDLDRQVAAFQVVPEYERIQGLADEIDARIRATRAQDAADRRNLQDLEAAIQNEREPEVEYLKLAYRELGVTLPDVVLRHYDDVRAFHDSVLSNRRSYLAEEISSTRSRLEQRQFERQNLGGEQARLLRLLHEGGALTALTALQEQSAIARSQLETLKTRFDTARQLEATQAEIKFERSKLQQDITQDLVEREPIIEQINLMFQRFAAALYGPDREAYVDIAATDTSLRIAPHIGGENSQGIGKMVIFCFDLTITVIAHRAGRGPDFLVHDSHLFDGVDERQVAEALKLAKTVCEEERLQYITTMNSDDLEKVERRGVPLQSFIAAPRLTDAYADGGLFGFHFG
ncbi:ABC-three component system protein [Rhodococcus sp. 66b]|uniref:ABC-three component system protein n=1 Tax=Rhodococcus sp. 66b TaxID=1945511 RepID=UPI0009BC6360|nr:ABC-three component system protein [Rhodococcus sp. 66b]OQM78049.1 hypothetical protein B0E55_06094 [Rhodococcus sp. 66b]